MKILFVTIALGLMACPVFAQTPAPAESPVATPVGHEVSAGISTYTYREPGAQAISIHGAKFAAAYTGTFSLSRAHHWFAQADVSGLVGNTAYDGWCSPFLIAPNTSSPNGYELDVGDPSPCSETGDKDWYVEGRALLGKDLLGQRWSASPYTGVGLRHLSNGTAGIPGYRTDNYLYLPFGVTIRTLKGARGPLSINVEADGLLHGWQETRDSLLGGGDVPGTSTAPPFTIGGFTNISFAQSSGWAVRASAKYPVAAHLSLEPYYVHWSVKASPVNYETATFTVNAITASEQLGAYEPNNNTNEFGIRLGFHF